MLHPWCGQAFLFFSYFTLSDFIYLFFHSFFFSFLNLTILLSVSPSLLQRKPEDPPMELDQSETRTQKPFSYQSSNRSSASPGPCPPPPLPPSSTATARLSPCCRSPAAVRLHPKSTPCPAPSPAVAAPRSPALSPGPAPPHPPTRADPQEQRAEGQPPQDYPQSLEPGECLYCLSLCAGEHCSLETPQDWRLCLARVGILKDFTCSSPPIIVGQKWL